MVRVYQVRIKGGEQKRKKDLITKGVGGRGVGKGVLISPP